MINKAILIGNAGADPIVRLSSKGTKVAHISLATTERSRNDDGSINTQTEWHSLIFFGRVAEIAERYIRKGTQIYAEGSIHYHKYVDKEGIERYSTDITVREFKLLGRRESVETIPIQQTVRSVQPQQTATASFGGGTVTPGFSSSFQPEVQSKPAPSQSYTQQPEYTDDLPF